MASGEEFEDVLDAVLVELRAFGNYQTRENPGNYWVNFDDYGDNEIGIVVTRLIDDQALFAGLRRALSGFSGKWTVRVSYSKELDMVRNGQILVSKSGWKMSPAA
jgi:hypothetical protein